MLSKTYRLARARDFDRVYKKGQRLKIDNLQISYLKTKNEATRLGFVVSKKVSNKASRRNYLKRLLRAAFRELPSGTTLSYDVVVGLSTDPVNFPVKPVKLLPFSESVASKLVLRLHV